MEKDPDYGMGINVRTAKHKTVHLGTSYYFCCAMCKELFEATPNKYIPI